jgi:hypothetical protein
VLVGLLAGVLAIALVTGVVLGVSHRSADATVAGAAGQGAVPSGTDGQGADAQSSGSPTPQAGETTADASADASAAASAAAQAAEEQARAQLGSLRSASLAQLTLDDRWVAQVASKSVGITDPLQTAANGSHVFYAADILAEVRQAQVTAGSAGNVLVLWSTDFGKRSAGPDGQPYWVTVVDGGFAGSTAVKDWCARTYSQLDAAELADTCVPRTLGSPHD